MPSDEHVKAHIELAIERAREGVSERIDEIDRRIRHDLDFGRIAGEHVPQVIAIGIGLGFLAGYGVPRVILRTIQIGIPIAIAVQIVRKRLSQAPPLNAS
jgi:hypothetical protein